MTVNFTPGDLVRARGREWVALPTPGDGLLALRPLSGNENNIVVLAPDLELTPVEAARFDLPDDAPVGVRFIDYRGINDPMIYIKVTPNRPDALGVRGIARDLAEGVGNALAEAAGGDKPAQ